MRGFEGHPRGAEASYQFTALEFTEPGARVFFGPRGDSGLNIQREAGRERESSAVTSPTSEAPRPADPPWLQGAGQGRVPVGASTLPLPPHRAGAPKTMRTGGVWRLLWTQGQTALYHLPHIWHEAHCLALGDP